MLHALLLKLGLLAALAGAALTALPATTAAGGGACRGQDVSDGIGTAVEMEGNCFVPTVLHVQPGDTVTWLSQDAEPHTVSGASVAWGDYSELAQGQSVAHRFGASGAYPYYCLLHPGMIGAVVVGDGSGAGAAGETVAVEPVEQAGPPAGGGASAEQAGREEGGGTSVAAIAIASGVSAAVGALAGAVGYAYRQRRRA